MFTQDDNYVGKQTSSTCEDAAYICIIILQKKKHEKHWVEKDLVYADVCVVLAMLMTVK